jgi:hypothetical protein
MEAELAEPRRSGRSAGKASEAQDRHILTTASRLSHASSITARGRLGRQTDAQADPIKPNPMPQKQRAAR